MAFIAAERQKGTPNRATAEIKAFAQKYGPEALETLVDLMRTSDDAKTRVAAAKEILDRAYGKPAQGSWLLARCDHAAAADFDRCANLR